MQSAQQYQFMDKLHPIHMVEYTAWNHDQRVQFLEQMKTLLGPDASYGVDLYSLGYVMVGTAKAFQKRDLTVAGRSPDGLLLYVVQSTTPLARATNSASPAHGWSLTSPCPHGYPQNGDCQDGTTSQCILEKLSIRGASIQCGSRASEILSRFLEGAPSPGKPGRSTPLGLSESMEGIENDSHMEDGCQKKRKRPANNVDELSRKKPLA